MTEHESRSGSDSWGDELQPAAAASVNGQNGLGEAVATAVPPLDATPADAMPPEATPALVAEGDEAATPAEAESVTEAAETDDGSHAAFIAEMARAMHATAGAEHVRIASGVEQRRAAHLEAVRARAATEADELRAESERDVLGIHSWADDEIARIQAERDRRVELRRSALERRLERHGAVIEQEVAAIEAAVSGYRAEVDAFFVRMAEEPDPAVIAGLVQAVPLEPRLSEIGASARAAAELEQGSEPGDTASPDRNDGEPGGGSPGPELPEISEARLLGVMDPQAVGQTGAAKAPWAVVDLPNARTGNLAEDPPDEEPAVVDEEAPLEATRGGSGGLLGAIPAFRPASSWLGRDQSRDKDPDR